MSDGAGFYNLLNQVQKGGIPNNAGSIPNNVNPVPYLSAINPSAFKAPQIDALAPMQAYRSVKSGGNVSAPINYQSVVASQGVNQDQNRPRPIAAGGK